MRGWVGKVFVVGGGTLRAIMCRTNFSEVQADSDTSHGGLNEGLLCGFVVWLIHGVLRGSIISIA